MTYHDLILMFARLADHWLLVLLCLSLTIMGIYALALRALWRFAAESDDS
mgnify:CR=1 FL=1